MVFSGGLLLDGEIKSNIQIYVMSRSELIHFFDKGKILNKARDFIYIVRKYPVLFRKAHKTPDILMCKFQYFAAFMRAPEFNGL